MFSMFMYTELTFSIQSFHNTENIVCKPTMRICDGIKKTYID